MTGLLLMLAAATTQPAEQPRAVERYVDCIKSGILNPAAEPAGFDDALEGAKAACGTLRPAALDAVRNKRGGDIVKKGGDAAAGSETMLDVLIDEQAAKAWAGLHPDDVNSAQ